MKLPLTVVQELLPPTFTKVVGLPENTFDYEDIRFNLIYFTYWLWDIHFCMCPTPSHTEMSGTKQNYSSIVHLPRYIHSNHLLYM